MNPNDDAGFAGDSVYLRRDSEGVDVRDGCAETVSPDRGDLLRHIGAFVRDEHATGPKKRPGQADEHGKVRDAPDEDRMVVCSVLGVAGEYLGTLTDRTGLRKREAMDDTEKKAEPLALGVQEDDPHLGENDLEGQTGETGATSQIKDDRPGRKIQEGQRRERVEKVVGDNAGLVRSRDEVDSRVPGEKMILVCSEQGEKAGIQFKAEMFRAFGETSDANYISFQNNKICR